MTKLLPVKPFLAVMAALGVALVLACGFIGGGSDGGNGGEVPSVESLLQLLPRDAEAFTYADLDELRDERLEDIEEQLADLAGEERLDDWGIDLDDAESLLIADLDSRDALVLLRGQFVPEDIEDALDDEGLRDGDYLGVPIWSERDGGAAVALVGEDVVLIGQENLIEESIDAFLGDARSNRMMRPGDLLEALEDSLIYSVSEECSFRGCIRQGSAIKEEYGDFLAVSVYLYRSDDAAADAGWDIENYLEEEFGDDIIVEADGRLVLATLVAETEEERWSLGRGAWDVAFWPGRNSSRGEPTPHFPYG